MIAHSDQPEQSKRLLDQLVSVFRGARYTTAAETVPLGTVLQRIQDGTYRERIADVRMHKLGGMGTYKRAKEALPGFTPCCAIRTRDKDVPWSEKLLSTTGLVHYDFDNVEYPAVLKSQLASNPATVFAFIG